MIWILWEADVRRILDVQEIDWGDAWEGKGKVDLCSAPLWTPQVCVVRACQSKQCHLGMSDSDRCLFIYFFFNVVDQ